MKDLDYSGLSAEFVRALRGSQSQRTLSRRLGFQSNVVYQWEAARRHPSMLQVFDMLRLLRPDGSGLSEIEPIDTLESVATYLEGFAPDLGPTDVGRLIDRSRHTVSRWFRAESQPKLPEFLLYVQRTRGKALDWLAAFVDPYDLPTATETWAQIQSVRELIQREPLAVAVANAVGLQGYRALPRHEPGWIAARLSMDVGRERELLDELASAGVMRKGATHWEVEQPLDRFIDEPVDYWLGRRGAAPFQEKFVVSAVTDRTRAKLSQLTRDYWRDVGDLLESDRDAGDQIVAMTVLAMRVDEARSA